MGKLLSILGFIILLLINLINIIFDKIPTLYSILICSVAGIMMFVGIYISDILNK